MDKSLAGGRRDGLTRVQPGACQRATDAGGQREWLDQVEQAVGFALQAIVNIHTGGVYGYEALLRGASALGFLEVHDLFTAALDRGCANAMEMDLRRIAIAHFARLPNPERFRLFLNLDPRLIAQDRVDDTVALLKHHGLPPETICFELSERVDLTTTPEMARLIDAYRGHRFQLAIDDFGTGYAGLRQLYEHPPDLLKIDRFFIKGIADDHRKRLFVANTVHLAHVMGIGVVAEGVETESELLACKEVGCDLVQGFLIARPQLDVGALHASYSRIAEINDRNRREVHGDRILIEACLEQIPPLHQDDGVKAMFEAFRIARGHHVIPVLDPADRPVGLIHEADIKEFIYSIYGRDLILNRAYARSLLDFVSPCPVVDIHDSAERLIEAYSAIVNPAGLIVTQDARYLGFVSAMSLLQLIEQKNLAAARDQNPLTKLPGNNRIYEYVSRTLDDRDHLYHLVYFDFDNFKAFNDHYGFRRGDRAILMFAELLRKHLRAGGSWFVGHIGGDDFFAGSRGVSSELVTDQVEHLLDKFRLDVQSLYDAEDRQRGSIRALDRYGQERDMPLIRCSAALLRVEPGHDFGGVEELSRIIAEAKHRAKSDRGGLVLCQLPAQARATQSTIMRHAMCSTSGGDDTGATPCPCLDEHPGWDRDVEPPHAEPGGPIGVAKPAYQRGLTNPP